jgi:hypothetical protein
MPLHRMVPVVASLALVAGACGSQGGSSEAAAPGGSIAALKGGGEEVSMLQAQSFLPTGRAEFTFGLVDSGGRLLGGGAPQVWAATGEDSPALGPFAATFHRFEAGADYPNDAPKSPLTGFYSAEVEVPESGTWVVAAVAEVEGRRLVGTGSMAFRAPDDVPAAVGSKALATKTPVAGTEEEARKICTREPPDPMHYISLDDALANGKPTVVNFGTPLLCESQMCGPVVDEAYAVYDRVGPDRANFIHVEIYPDRDQRHPAPQFLEWGFTTEPWTIVIDSDGVIRASFEGPVVSSQIEDALRPLLD